jgi:hypothetical protein
MKADERKAGALAAQDLEDIRTLKKSPAWSRYWERVVVGEVQRLRERILTDRKLTKDELWEERLKFFAQLDLSQRILQDEAACRSIIEGLPREPDDSEDSATREE